MALKTEEKSDKSDNVKVFDRPKQETKKIRKKYSSRRIDLRVRKRTTIENNTNSEYYNSNQCSVKLQGLLSATAGTMFYPPCPQYYPITFDEWSPVIPVHCQLYSLQPIPIIVNPSVLPTQICPFSPIVPIVPTVTVANEFPAAPLVSTNEFSLHMSNEVSPLPNKLSPYCEMSPASCNGFSMAVSNEVAFPVLPTSPYTPKVSYESTPHISNEFSQFEYQCSPIQTTMPDMFSPIQNIQVSNEYIPFCAAVSNESSLSVGSYDSFSCEYLGSERPVFHEAVQEQNNYLDKPLEFYLSLPKDLFPTARMMTMDPNLIIDEFCKVPNMDDHSWILDLEFGIPRVPVTRRVATYNVKLNSIHCKNVPEAIHPGFESCDKDLKRVLMFYYDCVISNWYRGYMALSSDSSVSNFQTWLLLPMQILGMCWP